MHFFEDIGATQATDGEQDVQNLICWLVSKKNSVKVGHAPSLSTPV